MSYFCVWIWFKFHSFECEHPNFLAHLLKRLFFLLGVFLAFLSKISWPCMHWFISGWALCSVALVYVSVFMPVIYVLIIIASHFEIRMCDSFRFFFFLNFVVDICIYSWFHMNYSIFFYVCKKVRKFNCGIFKNLYFLAV